MIERYRRATIALGYAGDSVVNSLGDIASYAVAAGTRPPTSRHTTSGT